MPRRYILHPDIHYHFNVQHTLVAVFSFLLSVCSKAANTTVALFSHFAQPMSSTNWRRAKKILKNASERKITSFFFAREEDKENKNQRAKCENSEGEELERK